MLLKKNNWAYEKIGDISEKILAGGDKPKVFSEVMTNECYIPVYANGVYNNGLCGYTNMPIIKDECITISARGTIGFCCIRTTPFVPIVRLIVVVPKSSIANKFLCYALRNLNIEKNGGTIPQLTVPMIKGYVIPIPPLPEQSRIVEELDLLSNIIEKKRQQLSELDNLAQSIFYDMFILKGEKWKEMALIDIYKFIDYRGKTPNKIDSGIPLITARNIRKGFIDYTVKEYISEAEFKNRQSRGIARKGDLLFTTEAPMGYVAIADLETFSTGQRLISFQQRSIGVVSNVFVLYYLLSDVFQTELNKQATGATVKGIKGSKLEKMIVPLPPLSVQQLFAQKIEAIEKQKALIKQSIAETEELFNSRMDYYFS